jgi:hypothetical protein
MSQKLPPEEKKRNIGLRLHPEMIKAIQKYGKLQACIEEAVRLWLSSKETEPKKA